MDEAVFVDADGQVEEVHSSVLDVKLAGELDVGFFFFGFRVPSTILI